MGRKNSLAKNSIQMLCVMQHLDEQNLYERSKLLLSIYRMYAGRPVTVLQCFVKKQNIVMAENWRRASISECLHLL